MKPNNIISLLVLVAVAGAGIYYFMYRTNTTSMEGNIVVIETDKGVIKAELRPEEAPKTVANFTDLVGKKFYDGLVFHRVVPDFVIQGGDPKGDGTGGSGTNIPLEIKCQDGSIMEGKEVSCAVALPHSDGALAMARSADPNSASSQFYITLGDQAFLNGKYAVFGYVTEGKEIAHLISQGSTIKRIYLENK
ncbi:MAG: peptidylprolyl isomerase [Candidatus Azambacteria bacterium]|nr:peptidylprolyl isomerase [Candidatus Azambacteria bacterium]